MNEKSLGMGNNIGEQYRLGRNCKIHFHEQRISVLLEKGEVLSNIICNQEKKICPNWLKLIGIQRYRCREQSFLHF